MSVLTQTDLTYVNTLATCIAKGENPTFPPPQSLPIDVQSIITLDQSSLSSEEKVVELEELKTKIQTVHDGGISPAIFKSTHPPKAAPHLDAATEQQYQKTIKNIEMLEHIATSKDLIERNPLYGATNTKIVLDGVEINCHASVLTEKCGLLRIGKSIDTFYDAEKTTKGKQIDPQLYKRFCDIATKETHPEVMSAILRYIYTGKVVIKPELLPEYHAACEKLKISGRDRMGADLEIPKGDAAAFKKMAESIGDENISNAVKEAATMAEERDTVSTASREKIAQFSNANLDNAANTNRKEFETKPVGSTIGRTISVLLTLTKILIKVLLALAVTAAYLFLFVKLVEANAAILAVPIMLGWVVSNTLGHIAVFDYANKKISLPTALGMGILGGLSTVSGVLLLSAYNDWLEIKGKSSKGSEAPQPI